jgi:hypothetical protein
MGSRHLTIIDKDKLKTMCLLKLKSPGEKLTKSLTVWKILRLKPNDRTRLLPAYYPRAKFSYTPGRVYRTQLKKTVESVHRLACFDSLAIRAKAELIEEHGARQIEGWTQGFHSAQTVARLLDASDHGRLEAWQERHPELVIYECTIPVGSTVHRDSTGLLISSRIVIDRQLTNIQHEKDSTDSNSTFE